ncbi:MAG TPA: trypsin-like serine protease [Dyella sp.]|uniref:trypsin-like serine protease n=1 Tax=Dyella sp. TaxID=1869338 RepID=UPI002F91DCBD
MPTKAASCVGQILRLSFAGLIATSSPWATEQAFARKISLAHAVISNDIAGGERVAEDDVPAWAAVVIINLGGVNESECSGSFLSSTFVLTAKHCLWTDDKNNLLDARSISVTTPGNYQKGEDVKSGYLYSVVNAFPSSRADIVLLELERSNDRVQNFPLFHGYRAYQDDFFVAYGASGLSGDATNEWHHLHRATVQLRGWQVIPTGFTTPMYLGEWPGSVPADFPPGGVTQPGDSGGAALTELKVSERFRAQKRIMKAAALDQASMWEAGGRGSAFSPLDDNELGQIGVHVGLIKFPPDGLFFYMNEGFDVQVSDANAQPVTRIELSKDASTPIKVCYSDDFKLLENGNWGCLFDPPSREGLYAIKAFRLDGSYDEVNIEYRDGPPADGSGLKISQPAPPSPR